MKKNSLTTRTIFQTIGMICGLLLVCGCEATYKADHLESSVKEVLRKEYGIHDVEVKVVGKTLGVYLPLENLFSANLDVFASGDMEPDIENLFRFNPHAMDMVEDVLFTTSRVVLSTDKDIDFYVLKAVENRSTGIEFVLTGYVMDMKLVRYWAIPRSEYSKRLLHDLSINRTIVWKRTVTDFFDLIGTSAAVDFLGTYFAKDVTAKDLSPFFFTQIAEAVHKDDLNYELIDIRTKPINEREVLVYVKLKENFTPKPEYETYDFLFRPGEEHEYLFVLQAEKMSYKIRQVIPFYFIDKKNTLQSIDFPDELKIYDNIGTWTEEFEIEDISLGEFIARQLTKRLQATVSQPEVFTQPLSIRKLDCVYHAPRSDETGSVTEPSYFSIEYDLGARSFLAISMSPEKEKFEADQNIKKLIGIILAEFKQVVQSYKFKDYSYLELSHTTSGKKVIIPAFEVESYKDGDLPLDSIPGIQN
jgi:hypothetical protein